MSERPVSSVPRAVLTFLAVGLAAQLALKAGTARPVAAAEDLPPPPSVGALRLASFGEPIALAKGLMLYVQAFDFQSGTRVPYRNLDYHRVEAWLSAILELDPSGQYPLLAASRLYAEVPNEAKQRSMLDFIYRQFLVDPNRRWPWLAHATVIAKHRVHDLPLALRYARAIEQLATAPDVPLWARQMQAFILEDMDELDASRLILGGYVSSGKVKDPAELRFLEKRLEELEGQGRRIPRK